MQSTKQKKRLTRKRQWGAERRRQPLPMMHEKPSTLKIAYSRLAIVLTIVLWVMYLISTIIRQFFEGPKTFSFTMQAIGYLIIVRLLTFSTLMYLVARQGALQFGVTPVWSEGVTPRRKRRSRHDRRGGRLQLGYGSICQSPIEDEHDGRSCHHA